MIQSLLEIVPSLSQNLQLNCLVFLSLLLFFLVVQLINQAHSLFARQLTSKKKIKRPTNKTINKTAGKKIEKVLTKTREIPALRKQEDTSAFQPSEGVHKPSPWLTNSEEASQVSKNFRGIKTRKVNKKELRKRLESNLERGHLFFPLLATNSDLFPRFQEINELKEIIKAEKVVLVSGEAGTGKTSLASAYSREARFLENKSVLSFRFDLNSLSLQEMARFILLGQLERDPSELQTKDPLTLLWSILQEESFLLILGNLELLDANELKFLFQEDPGKSNLLLLASQDLRSTSIPGIESKSLVLEPLQDSKSREFLSENSEAFLDLPEKQVASLINLLQGDLFALALFRNLLRHKSKQQADFNFSELFLTINQTCFDKQACFTFFLKELIQDLDLLEKECLFSLVNLKVQHFSADLLREILGSPFSEVQNVLEKLFRFDLVQKVSQSSSKRSNLVYSLHPKIRESILQEFDFKQDDYFLVNQKAAKFYLQNINQINKKGFKQHKEITTNIFELKNLLESLKFIDPSIFQESRFFVLFQKSLKYIQSSGFYSQARESLISIFEDGFLNSNQSPHLSVHLFWTEIMAISKLVFSENFLSYEKELSDLNEAIFLFQKALNLINNESGYYPNKEKLRELTYFNLGQAFLRRFDLQDREEDLRKALENLRIPMEASGGNLPIDFYLVIAQTYLKASFFESKDRVARQEKINTSLRILLRAKELYQRAGKQAKDEYTFYQIIENMGKTYRLLADLQSTLEREESLSKAVESYQEALNLSHRLVNTNKAFLLNNIGCCFWGLSKEKDPQENIEKAIFYYKACLEEVQKKESSEKNKLKKAVLYSNLGISYKALASFGEIEENLALSAAYFQEANKEAETSTDKALKVNIKTNLNKLEEVLGKLIKLQDRETTKESFSLEDRFEDNLLEKETLILK